MVCGCGAGGDEACLDCFELPPLSSLLRVRNILDWDLPPPPPPAPDPDLLGLLFGEDAVGERLGLCGVATVVAMV